MPGSDDLAKPLGTAIRVARVRRGLSQEDLAKAASVNPGFLGGIERGQRNPTMTTLQRIAQALGLSLPQLMAAVDEERARLRERGGQITDDASHEAEPES